MKLFVFLLNVFIFSSSLAQNAKISVDKNTHKFPATKQGEVVDHEFMVTNTGTTPLIISDYSVACTKVLLPKQPIPPGETYALKVTFDTKGKYYFQDRTIHLVTNTKKGKYSLRIKVKVTE